MSLLKVFIVVAVLILLVATCYVFFLPSTANLFFIGGFHDFHRNINGNQLTITQTLVQNAQELGDRKRPGRPPAQEQVATNHPNSDSTPMVRAFSAMEWVISIVVGCFR